MSYYHSGKRFWSHHRLFSERVKAFNEAERPGVTRQRGENIPLPQSTNPAHTQLPSTSWSNHPKATKWVGIQLEETQRRGQRSSKVWKTEQMRTVQLQEAMAQCGIMEEVIIPKVIKEE